MEAMGVQHVLEQMTPVTSGYLTTEQTFATKIFIVPLLLLDTQNGFLEQQQKQQQIKKIKKYYN